MLLSCNFKPQSLSVSILTKMSCSIRSLMALPSHFPDRRATVHHGTPAFPFREAGVSVSFIGSYASSPKLPLTLIRHRDPPAAVVLTTPAASGVCGAGIAIGIAMVVWPEPKTRTKV
jgi:hypothetical protein